MKELLGYRRPDGKFGIRNLVLVMSTVGCANETVNRIVSEVEGAVAIPNQKGCGQVGDSMEILRRTMAGFAANPNVYGTILVGLGCETNKPSVIADRIKEITNKPLEVLTIQEVGGTIKTIKEGIKRAKAMVADMNLASLSKGSLSEITLATNCGGSDATSGLSPNPALGVCSDMLIHHGGTVIIGETTELIGAEHILANRANTPETAQRILELVQSLERTFMDMGLSVRGANPTPGNMAGGLSTLEEKSLGGISKLGSTVINEVVKYGEIPTKKGSIIMDTPGYDIESVSAMVAGGAQLCVFTTGRGSPIGNAIIPMIKITGNEDTALNMQDNIDIDLSGILRGEMTIYEGGNYIYDRVISTCEGELSKAEIHGFKEISIYRNNEVWCCNLQ